MMTGNSRRSATASARMEPLQTIESTINHVTATYGVFSMGKGKHKEFTT